MLRDFNQWSTAAPLVDGSSPYISDSLEALRISSYSLYEQMYWNVPESFKLIQRGADSKPIYIPAAKKIVETIHRFMAPSIDFVPDPEFGTEAEHTTAMQTLRDLFTRERFASSFNSAKRYGLIRGDWLLHVYADPERNEGSRISLKWVDPAAYFPIYDDEDLDSIIGCHLIEEWTDDEGEMFIRRLTYLKETGKGGPSPIIRTDEVYDIDDWGGPGMEEATPQRSLQPPMRLPDPIDSIPVYHIQNFQENGSTWGSSEIRGMERLIASMNQGASDEELAIALEALGVYVTDAGKPIDEDSGEEVPWNLGPGRVVELPEGKQFIRVQGVSSLEPYQSHLEYISNWLDIGSGTPAVAAGKVDVRVAESGVALLLEMGPILARAEEKELIVTDVLNNFLYDLRKWFQAYEPAALTGNLEGIRWNPVYGDKLPINRKQKLDEIVKMATTTPVPLVSGAWARREAAKLGYEFGSDTDMMDEILAERGSLAAVEADALGARMDREIDSIEGEGGGDEGASDDGEVVGE